MVSCIYFFFVSSVSIYLLEEKMKRLGDQKKIGDIVKEDSTLLF